MLSIEWNDPIMAELQSYFNANEPDVFYKTHYDLAKSSGRDANAWKKFLTEPQVSDYITQEVRILQQNVMRTLIRDLNTNARSPGAGQALAALTKTLEASAPKEGPTFVVMYVPLTENEQRSPRVRRLVKDPFRRDTV
jgi:hypothetical protein